MPHTGDRRPIPIWKRGALAAVLVSLALPAARAQDYKPDGQYKYTPEQPQTPNQPQNQGNTQYPQYKPLEYKQPEYKPPEYKPPEYKPPQYPQYPQYQVPKAPPGQYRGSPQDQQACINDVMRLCNQFVPDVPRIISCLQSNRKNLSAPCRAVFSRGRRGK